MEAFRSFDNKRCTRVGRKGKKMLAVQLGLRPGCISHLFNIYMGRVVTLMNEIVIEKSATLKTSRVKCSGEIK